MKKLARLFLAGALTTTLAGCETAEEANTTESTVQEANSNGDKLNEAGTGEYTDISDINFMDPEIDWNAIHISRTDFRSFLEELVQPEPEDLDIVKADFTNETVTLTLYTELNESEISEDFGLAINLAFTTAIMDGLIRHLAIHSAYDINPTIEFVNLNGDILAINSDFLETETSEETAEASGEFEANSIAMGEVFEINDWEIEITATEMVENIPSGDFLNFTPNDEGNLFLVVELSVTNRGTSARDFLPMFRTNNDLNATVFYDGNFSYQPTTLLGHDGDLASMTSITALGQRNGFLAFSIPPVVQDSDNPLTIVFNAGRQEMTFQIR